MVLVSQKCTIPSPVLSIPTKRLEYNIILQFGLLQVYVFLSELGKNPEREEAYRFFWVSLDGQTRRLLGILRSNSFQNNRLIWVGSWYFISIRQLTLKMTVMFMRQYGKYTLTNDYNYNLDTETFYSNYNCLIKAYSFIYTDIVSSRLYLIKKKTSGYFFFGLVCAFPLSIKWSTVVYSSYILWPIQIYEKYFYHIKDKGTAFFQLERAILSCPCA